MSKSPRILLVDDEPRALELLARSLRKTGKTQSAESGEVAVAMLAEADFDLVISDQRMPGLSGVDLLSQIAEDRPETGRILLTGYADLEATVAAINRGRVHAYLHKPCAPSDLLMVVDNVLERVHLSRENSRLAALIRERGADAEAGTPAALSPHSAERIAEIGRGVRQSIARLRGPASSSLAAAAEIQDEAANEKLDDLVELAARIESDCHEVMRTCEALEGLVPTPDAEGEALSASVERAPKTGE